MTNQEVAERKKKKWKYVMGLIITVLIIIIVSVFVGKKNKAESLVEKQEIFETPAKEEAQCPKGKLHSVDGCVTCQ